MKFLIISDYSTGGAGHVAKITSELLNKSENDSKLIFGNKYFRFNFFGYIFNIKGYKLILRALSDLKPDVVMIHNYDNLWSPLILKAINNYKKKHNITVIFTLHDYHIVSASNSMTYYKNNKLMFFDSPPSIAELLINKIDRRNRLFGFARIVQWYAYYNFFKFDSVIDGYICPSEFMKSKLVQRHQNKRIEVLYNPSTFETVSPVISLGNVIKVVFAGRLTRDKGILKFLHLVNESKIELKRMIEVDIIGDGVDFKDINQLSLGTRTNLKINLHGVLPHSEVKDILKTADFVLLPSVVYENAPLSLIEGVFMGCHVITMNYGGMKEVGDQLPHSIMLDNLSTTEVSKVLNKLNSLSVLQSDELIRNSMIEKYSSSKYSSTLLLFINKIRDSKLLN